MALSNLGKNIFIGDSAATSHMTSNQLNTHKRLCDDWKWEDHHLHSQRKNGCDLQTLGWVHSKGNWGGEIVPQLNHDCFSFTKP